MNNKKKLLANQKGGTALIVFLLIAILGVLLMTTRPNEQKLRQGVAAEFGAMGAMANMAGTVGQLMGAIKFRYQDYLVFSVLYIQLNGQQEEQLAIGCAGQVFTKENVKKLRSTIENKIKTHQ